MRLYCYINSGGMFSDVGQDHHPKPSGWTMCIVAVGTGA